MRMMWGVELEHISVRTILQSIQGCTEYGVESFATVLKPEDEC